jgi:hypothetical protein
VEKKSKFCAGSELWEKTAEVMDLFSLNIVKKQKTGIFSICMAPTMRGRKNHLYNNEWGMGIWTEYRY